MGEKVIDASDYNVLGAQIIPKCLCTKYAISTITQKLIEKLNIRRR